MSTTGFEPMLEVTADDRARIPIGRLGVHSNDRFLVSTKPTGEILLTPLASIPKRELLIWENEQVRDSLRRGLHEASDGQIETADHLLEDNEE